MQKHPLRLATLLKGLSAGAAAGYLAAQLAWVWRQIGHIDVQRSLEQHTNQAQKGYRLIAQGATDHSIYTHTIEDGIERIDYLPKQRRFETPIVLQHGMWHGAWCWKAWQELFAEWGWETRAHSLPGHTGSPTQRAIGACTLDYYLGFLKAEIERQPHKPVLIGHSMGGALTQWYLKYVGDDLPAAALVAPWPAHSLLRKGIWRTLRLDVSLAARMIAAWDAWPMVHSPRAAGRLLLGPDVVVTPAELHTQLGRESALVMFQHNPPFWQPPHPIQTPLLIYAGELDAGIPVEELRLSAEYYACDFLLAPRAGHNLMMEHDYRQIARNIYEWLVAQNIP